MENYLLLDIEKTHITNFAKLRISNSKLMIEQGRYKRIAVNDRICPVCTTSVEDEYHFTVHCKAIKEPRNKLFNKLKEVLPDFMTINNKNKFELILGSNDMDISKICVVGISDMYAERLKIEQGIGL